MVNLYISDSTERMSLREIEKKSKEALLVTFVKQFKTTGEPLEGSYFEDKVLILTKKHVVVCDYKPDQWSYPIHWSDIQMMSKNEFDKKQQEIDSRIDKKQRETDTNNLRLERNAKRESLTLAKIHQRRSWTDLLSVSYPLKGNAPMCFLRKNLVEAAFAKKTSEAAVYLGFKQTGKGETTEESEFRLFGAKGDMDGKSRANQHFCFLFPSDSSREEWRIGLEPQLVEMEKNDKSKGKR